jgi:hypothetical protein
MIGHASRSLLRSILVPAAFVALMAQGASSSTVTLSGFNLITSGDVSTNSDVGGAVLIGGTLQTGLTFGGNLSNPSAGTTAVINTIGSGVNFLNTNNTIAGNVSTGAGNFYESSSSSTSLSKFTQSTNTVSSYTTGLSTYLSNVSQGYGSLAINSSYSTTLTNGQLDLVAGTPTNIGGQSVLVFSISLSTLLGLTNDNITLTNSSGASISLAAGETMIVNVAGTPLQGGPTAFSSSVNSNLVGLHDSANILFNFENATSLSGIPNLGASILAPNATLNTNNSLVGGIYVQAIQNVGEIDMAQSNGTGTTNGGFTGYVPSGGVVPNVVPEPASVAMIVIGGGIAAGYTAVRRRRAAKA